MKLLYTTILSLLFFIFCLPLYSSIEISSEKITTNDGLCNNNVRYIYQDSKGFIWLSTLNGLSRYDGNSFTTFRPDNDEGKISLADLRVGEITEDKNGFLWIYTVSQHFSCFSLKENRFIDFTGNKEYESRYSEKLITSNGDIWFWHIKNGCHKVVYDDEKYTSFSFTKEGNNLSDSNVHNIVEGSNGRIWVATAKG